ncbi:ZIP family metal transporter [Mycoplasma sp. 128]|uniref:ZIP family metal transporter n=1 Tax=Mycoplasma sp. 3341 TaxID=3447506 RepID=UPI003F65E30C
MFFTQSTFNNNYGLTIFVNLLLYILILLLGPMIISFLVGLVKKNVKSSKMIYLYAFSAGMFLMIGALGFMKESSTGLETWFHSSDQGKSLTGGSSAKEQLYMALIMGISSFVGLGLVIGWRFAMVKLSKEEVHKSHTDHNHSDHFISLTDIDNPRAAWVAIFMLLSHRIIDGIVLGYSVFQFTSDDYTNPNISLIVTFNIHILIESLIIYYRQLQYGQTRWKALLYNFYTMLLIIPVMFIGAYSGPLFLKSGWLLPALQTLAGAVIVFTSVFELIPEFIHARNDKPKVVYLTFISFSLSIVFSIILLSFHTHNGSVSLQGGDIIYEQAKNLKYIMV